MLMTLGMLTCSSFSEWLSQLQVSLVEFTGLPRVYELLDSTSDRISISRSPLCFNFFSAAYLLLLLRGVQLVDV